MSELHPWIILFDIDGTLLTVDHTFNRPLIREILDDLEIDYPDMEEDSFSGRTDHDIFTSFLVNHDYDTDLYETCKQTYLTRLENKLNKEHVIRHSHVDETIEFFTSDSHIKGLLTGNYPQAAEVKLRAAEIDYDFSVGAFGEHNRDRNQLPYLAIDQIRNDLGIDPEPARFVIIGDTPRDIICGKNAGMKVVAVTTGSYSAEELAQHKPDLIIDSLAGPESWFSKIAG